MWWWCIDIDVFVRRIPLLTRMIFWSRINFLIQLKKNTDVIAPSNALNTIIINNKSLFLSSVACKTNKRINYHYLFIMFEVNTHNENNKYRTQVCAICVSRVWYIHAWQMMSCIFMQILFKYLCITYQRTIFFVFLKFTVRSCITFQSFTNNARIIFTVQFICLTIATFLAKCWIIYGKCWIYCLFIGIKSNVNTICFRFKWFGNDSTKML